MLHRTWEATWQRLRLLSVVGVAGATVIFRLSAAHLVGLEDSRLRASIGEHS